MMDDASRFLGTVKRRCCIVQVCRQFSKPMCAVVDNSLQSPTVDNAMQRSHHQSSSPSRLQRRLLCGPAVRDRPTDRAPVLPLSNIARLQAYTLSLQPVGFGSSCNTKIRQCQTRIYEHLHAIQLLHVQGVDGSRNSERGRVNRTSATDNENDN